MEILRRSIFLGIRTSNLPKLKRVQFRHRRQLLSEWSCVSVYGCAIGISSIRLAMNGCVVFIDKEIFQYTVVMSVTLS